MANKSMVKIKTNRPAPLVLTAIWLTIFINGCAVRDPEPVGEPSEIISDNAATKAPAVSQQSDTSLESAKTDNKAAKIHAAPAEISDPEPESLPVKPTYDDLVTALCQEVGTKLGSVSIDDCQRQRLRHSDWSTLRRSLAVKDYPPLATSKPLGRVLLIGGIHGDEFASVSVVFKWMDILSRYHSGMFHWRFIPLANPDGLLRKTSQRQNENGVDLNRNFPSSDWDKDALSHWVETTHRNPRRDPGPAQASEIETQWLVDQISAFQPAVIISVHAPHHLVDYDGPPTAPERLGKLSLRQQGVYPGSLGNYAGIDLSLPVVTVELQSAGIMPPPKEVDGMWRDLVRWLRRQLSDADSTTIARD